MKKILLLLFLVLVLISCSNKVDKANESNSEKEEKKTSEHKTIADLNIGDLVVDDSWKWEIKVNQGYTGIGLEKPVIWIVVAKNHYDIEDAHVTLLSKEILGRYSFDTSTNRGSQDGSNHWGNSGTDNANRGIRIFLNENFTKEFSNLFNSIVLTTNVPTAYWETGEIYYTSDRVFIPCRSEIDSDKRGIYQSGKLLEYFNVDDRLEEYNRRKAQLPGISAAEENYKDLNDYWNYLTRTPSNEKSSFIYRVVFDGNYSVGAAKDDYGFWGIRPLVNVKANTIVIEADNQTGVYKIIGIN